MIQLSMPLKAILKQKLSEHFSFAGHLEFQAVGGGSINETYRINFSDKAVFCKINSASKFPQLLVKEKKGLELILKQNLVKVPAVIDCFEQEDKQILLLEWIREGERTEGFWKKFGEQLAALHQRSSNSFGFDEDNYMGSVPQQNNRQQDWISFFIYQRIKPLINKCAANDLLRPNHHRRFEKLFTQLPSVFESKEKPSLLHGDLWSGNFMCNQAGEPVLIDPAIYFGHRSVDLAMTTLFGGFRKGFYDAYHYQFPFPPNYKEQWEVCNLYPLLIHLYLFGRSYLPQIEQTLQRFS